MIISCLFCALHKLSMRASKSIEKVKKTNDRMRKMSNKNHLQRKRINKRMKSSFCGYFPLARS